MTATHQRNGCWGRAKHADIIGERCFRGQFLAEVYGGAQVVGRDNHARQAAIGRHAGVAPCTAFRPVEGVAVGRCNRLQYGLGGIRRLQVHGTRPVFPSRAPGDLGQQVERALRRAQIAACQAQIGVDNADLGQVRGNDVPLRSTGYQQ